MKINKLVFIITLSFLIPLCVIGQENTKSVAGGPATLKQLVGFWKMIDLPSKEMNKVNPWPSNYQWFGFYENGKVYSMMLSENKDNKEYTAKELAEIFEVLPNDKTPNYKLDGQFIKIDNPEIKNYQELWGANIFAKDITGIALKGDMIMSLDDGSGNIIYYRLLRKIE